MKHKKPMTIGAPVALAALLIGSASWAAVNTNNPAGTTGTSSAGQNTPSTVTGSPMPTDPTRVNQPSVNQGLSGQRATPNMPNLLQNQNQMSPTEAQQRAQAPYMDAEVCADNDAACLRRRQEQIEGNTPFQQQTPPTPGVPGVVNPTTGTIDR